MDLKYRLTNETIEVSGMDLIGYRHKKSVYLGSFYVKDLREHNGAMVADYEDGDRPFIAYRDSIHEKHVGWKTPLVDLVSSFMKVAYLVSRGVIYQPFEDPDNFIYNISKHRVQVIGRYDTTLRYLDDKFLDWVMECIGFIISKEDKSEFGYLTHQEYYNNMDKDHKDLYKGYLQQKDFQALVEYTLEPSVIEVLDQYTPISRVPIDNKPTIREVLEKSVDEKEAYLKEQEEMYQQDNQQVDELGNLDSGELDLSERNNTILTKKQQREVKSGYKKQKKNKRYNSKQRLMNQDKIDEYRMRLGIPEDKHEYDKRRKGTNLLPTLLSIAFLAFAIWLAYTFYIWMF